MHDDESAFLAAIKEADPAEDTPRLVYADWLEENDRPTMARAIRLDVEVKNKEKALGHYRTVESMRQAIEVREMVADNYRSWFGLPPVDLDKANEIRLQFMTSRPPVLFDRGLIRLAGSVYGMYHGKELFPWVDGAMVSNPRGGAYMLMKLMAATGMRHLIFHPSAGGPMADLIGRFCRAVTREDEICKLQHIDFGYDIDVVALREMVHWDDYEVLSRLRSVTYGPRPHLGQVVTMADALEAVCALKETWKKLGRADLLVYDASNRQRF